MRVTGNFSGEVTQNLLVAYLENIFSCCKGIWRSNKLKMLFLY